MAVGTGLSHDGIPAYRLHDPAQQFVFPWVWTQAGAQWLNALVHRAPWDRCAVEQAYVSSLEMVVQANAGVSGLAGQMPERWYQAYARQVEGLCGVRG